MGNKQVKIAQLETQKTKLVQDGKTRREKIKAGVELAKLTMADIARKDTFRHNALQIEMYRGQQMSEKGVDVFDFNCYLAGINRALYNSKSDMDNKYLKDIVRHKVYYLTASSTSTSNGLGKQDEESDDDDEVSSELKQAK